MTDASQQRDTEIRRLLDQSFRFQKFIFYGMAGAAAVTGIAIIIMSFAIPPKPGEETIVLVLQGVSVIFLLFAGWSVWYVRQRLAKVLQLIFHAPEQIAKVEPFQAQKRGVVAFAIRLHTTDGRMVGFNVVGPKTQQRLVALLSAT